MRRVSALSAAFLLGAAALAAHTQQAPPAQPAAQGQQPRAQGPCGEQPPLGLTQWRIDTSHSAANFSVRHNVVSTVRGQLGPICGSIEYDGKDVRSIRADVTVDVTKINTQNASRDNHLRTDDFFNVEKYPTMSFRSKRAEPAGEGRFRLIGDLTIRDRTNEVVLEVEGPAPIIKGPRGVLTGATATTKISRQAYGVLWNRMIEAMPVVGDEVTITIDLELTRPAMPGDSQ
ncbi:MAG TPA: YceI family protein [Vicinamibacterales bacterium]|nr:YceI family protein [Vicinamibacterales bacterium]